MASEPPMDATRELPVRRRRWVPWLVLAMAGVALCYALPPVRFVRKTAQAQLPSTRGAAQPSEVWDRDLPGAIERAVDAKALLAAIRVDPAAAAAKHSRQVGIGGSYYYFLRGTGRVVSKKRSRLGVTITDGNATEPDVLITTGKVFGNAVRDGTGLFDMSAYPRSQDFNELSAELNKLVETRVLPALVERAEVGSQVEFAGVAEVGNEEADPRPLRVVPVAAELR